MPNGESRLEIVNCIFWNNSTVPAATEIGFCDLNYINDPGSASITYSAVDGGSGNIWFDTLTDVDADPLFAENGQWQDNGTPADLNDDLWLDGEYLLQVGSPCLDSGSDSALPLDLFDLNDNGNLNEPIPFDLERERRQQGPVNMGAYETQAEPAADLNGDGDVDAEDLEIMIPNFGNVECVGEICSGDLDGDGDLDGADIASFASQL